MIKKIHPTAIVVCGKVPAWLPKRHPDIQIVHIPSYSEMWHARAKRKLKGGHGGESGKARRKKDGFYKDSHDIKVTDKPKPPGKVIILSRHASFEVGFRAFCEGYKEATRKGFIRGEVEFWFHGEIHILE